MTEQDAVKWIKTASQGHVFAVKFVKRTTQEVRTMNCRLGVTSRLRGGEAAYDAAARGLITVFDMNKAGYRSIPAEGLIALEIDGQWHPVEHPDNCRP